MSFSQWECLSVGGRGGEGNRGGERSLKLERGFLDLSLDLSRPVQSGFPNREKNWQNLIWRKSEAVLHVCVEDDLTAAHTHTLVGSEPTETGRVKLWLQAAGNYILNCVWQITVNLPCWTRCAKFPPGKWNKQEFILRCCTRTIVSRHAIREK